MLVDIGLNVDGLTYSCMLVLELILGWFFGYIKLYWFYIYVGYNGFILPSIPILWVGQITKEPLPKFTLKLVVV